MLIAEQSVSPALEIADYGYVLQSCRTVLEGDAQSLADNPEVQCVYMGISAAPVMAH
jgi:branched-chain amino acid transport system ATP-binding protein